MYTVYGDLFIFIQFVFGKKVLCCLLFSHSVMSNSLQPPWTAACQGSLSFTISWSLCKLMSIESMMPSNHLILRHPLLLPKIFPSVRVFFSESTLHIRWPKYWSFNFSISLFNEFSGWFPLGLTGLISLQSKGLSRIFSNTTVQMHQFFHAQLSLWSKSHIHIRLMEIRQ